MERISSNIVESSGWTGEGFKPLIQTDGYQVAVLRYFDGVSAEKIVRIEKHNETDEIFILTEGEASMLVFDNNSLTDSPHVFRMQKNRVYNVKKGTWHQVMLTKEAHIFIFEKSDTSRENSGYHIPDKAMEQKILKELKKVSLK